MTVENFELSEQEKELLIQGGTALAGEAMGTEGQQRRQGRRSRRKERRAGRKATRQDRREARKGRRAARRGQGVSPRVSSIPRVGTGSAQSAGRVGLPDPATFRGARTDVVEAQANGNVPTAWWMDPKVLLLVGAAIFLLAPKPKR